MNTSSEPFQDEPGRDGYYTEEYGDDDLEKQDDDDDDDDDDSSTEEEILEYVDMVDEGYWTPNNWLLLLLVILVLGAAAGIGYGIYYAVTNDDDDNGGGINSSGGSGGGPDDSGTSSPSSSMTELPTFLFDCNICPNEGSVTTLSGIVPMLEGMTCETLLERAANRQISEGQCRLVQAQTSGPCGCSTNVTAPACTSVCPTEGHIVRNPDGIVDVSEAGFEGFPQLTCLQLNQFASSGLVPFDFCPQLQNASIAETICDCGPVCSLCPDREPIASVGNVAGTLTNLTAINNDIFSLDTDTLSCGQLQSLLTANYSQRDGDDNDETCSALQQQASEVCGCGPLSENNSTEELDLFVCDICSFQGDIRNPDGVIDFAGQSVTCQQMQGFGLQGQIEPTACTAVQPLTFDACDCGISDESDQAIVNSLQEVVGDAIEQRGTSEYNAARYLLFEDPRFHASPNTAIVRQRKLQPINLDGPINDGDVCPVCVNDGVIGNPDAIIEIPPGLDTIIEIPPDLILGETPSSISCRDLESQASTGAIPMFLCGLLQNAVVDICGCRSEDTVSSSKPEETPVPLACTVCAEGAVQNPEGKVEIPAGTLPGVTTPTIDCNQLQDVAGSIPEEFCSVLQRAAADVCECSMTPRQVGPDPECPVCANGVVRNSEGMVGIPEGSIPGVSALEVSCRQLTIFSFEGSIPIDLCPVFQTASSEVCDCGEFEEGGSDPTDDVVNPIPLPTLPGDEASQGVQEDPALLQVSLADLSFEAILQRYLMILFYFQTSNIRLTPWTQLGTDGGATDAWLSAVFECQWMGVTCNMEDEVTEIDLSMKGLTGSLDPSILLLPSLGILIVANNSLGGTLDSFFSQPAQVANETRANLQVLNVESNQFQGILPTDVSSMTSLEELRLGQNSWQGSIPSEMSGLSNLRILDLHGNELNGTLPVDLSSLVNLSLVDLSRNELTGPIPAEFGLLSNLETLNLLDNALQGEIPSPLFGLPSLETAILGQNNLVGTVPNVVCEWENGPQFHIDCEEISCECCSCCTEDGCADI